MWRAWAGGIRNNRLTWNVKFFFFCVSHEVRAHTHILVPVERHGFRTSANHLKSSFRPKVCHGQAAQNCVSDWLENGLCCSEQSPREKSIGQRHPFPSLAEEHYSQCIVPCPPPPHFQCPGMNGDLKMTIADTSALHKLDQKREKDRLPFTFEED